MPELCGKARSQQASCVPCRQELAKQRRVKAAADAKAKTETFAGLQLSFDENASSAWPLPGALWQTIFTHLTGE